MGSLANPSNSNGLGQFMVDIGVKLKAKTVISVYSINEYGNNSEVVTLTIVDKTAPSVPTVTGAVNSKSTNISNWLLCLYL
jgi:hypothetical protein